MALCTAARAVSRVCPAAGRSPYSRGLLRSKMACSARARTSSRRFAAGQRDFRECWKVSQDGVGQRLRGCPGATASGRLRMLGRKSQADEFSIPTVLGSLYDATMNLAILSVDVDDLLVANSDFFGQPLRPNHQAQIQRDLSIGLKLLDEVGAKATFFVNTQYCEQEEDFLSEIHRRGHVLASHGHRHRDVRRLTLLDFERDLVQSLEQLSRVQPNILGFRPPAFSMPYSEQYFRILVKHGIRYVSSGNGVARAQIPNTETPAPVFSDLIHVPISTMVMVRGRLKYPIGYGVASRLLPSDVYLRTLRLWLARKSFLHFYCHSFELAGTQRFKSTGFDDRGAALFTWIYMLRCWNRADHFRSVFREAAFRSIEDAVVLGMASRGGAINS
jgi:hypothetical protein